MITALKRLQRHTSSERGASLVEYALLVALIAVVCIAAVTFLGSSASGKFTKAGEAVEGEADDPYAGWSCVEPAFTGTHYLTNGTDTSPDFPGPCP